MYDFKNQMVNKMLLIGACFIGFIILSLILPGVVTAVLVVTFLWGVSGLTGWSLGRASGDISDEEGVPFYKESQFYEYIAMGPITLAKYLK